MYVATTLHKDYWDLTKVSKSGIMLLSHKVVREKKIILFLCFLAIRRPLNINVCTVYSGTASTNYTQPDTHTHITHYALRSVRRDYIKQFQTLQYSRCMRQICYAVMYLAANLPLRMGGDALNFSQIEAHYY